MTALSGSGHLCDQASCADKGSGSWPATAPSQIKQWSVECVFLICECLRSSFLLVWPWAGQPPHWPWRLVARVAQLGMSTVILSSCAGVMPEAESEAEAEGVVVAARRHQE